MPLMDPLVALFDSVHEKFPSTGSMKGVISLVEASRPW